MTTSQAQVQCVLGGREGRYTSDRWRGFLATIQTQHMSNIKELLKKKWPDEQETEKAVDLLETFIVHLQQDCFTPDLCFPISPSCDAGLSFHSNLAEEGCGNFQESRSSVYIVRKKAVNSQLGGQVEVLNNKNIFHETTLSNARKANLNCLTQGDLVHCMSVNCSTVRDLHKYDPNRKVIRKLCWMFIKICWVIGLKINIWASLTHFWKQILWTDDANR